ncbi:high-affinity Zn(2+) transporter zrt1 [Emydomyces testavorans]|uniref:High-affinity Zn(2+) transporter zrt1 n=1 Tax=Emydomyces testavorans TaxID=2070801 RepID=A0AAF0DIV1_9EURO|nr:high-affinity Zn(2+) transporter zrt1 [Emydomyces testavorans]
MHATETFCIAGDGKEVQITGPTKPNVTPPAQYTGCHNHGTKQFCIGPDKEEVEVLAAEAPEATPNNDHKDMDCHFHAGVEHCVPHGGSETAPKTSCGKVDRDYNVPYRIGSLFAILITSGIAVFSPVLWRRFSPSAASATALLIVKQFGTGVMVATAFVHLLTHAQLMFENPCLGDLKYEATTAGIMMAGLFLTFMMEYIGHRVIARAHTKGDMEGSASSLAQQTDNKDQTVPSATSSESPQQNFTADDKLSVVLLEAGIVFHSIIIGLTLVVAGNSGYTPLFIVIIFHQMFEGLALGSRIADLDKVALGMKALMAAIFTLITPVGMAIGLGVRHTFNGNSKGTIIIIGTLDSFSAGILAWAALVNMWSHDWIYGEFRQAGVLKSGLGLLSLVMGMALMSFLGKWA